VFAVDNYNTNPFIEVIMAEINSMAFGIEEYNQDLDRLRRRERRV